MITLHDIQKAKEGDIIETGLYNIDYINHWYVAVSQGAGTWCIYIMNLMPLDAFLDKQPEMTKAQRDAYANELTITKGKRLTKVPDDKTGVCDMELIRRIARIDDDTVFRSYQY